ncbi:uncharacterized protein si:ch211-214j8.12 [Toxotes jaculatrix]|uniref:uncharacterized protein si:ch211-214j8.12 n=1 Tax=Toxotes jaculatrix TaxID=941984 RepID=UPI001B3AC086|nr:uncharacterized protein si:ch211-214j8.12 [Toxotes jaculatrix]XP_040897314.1 uncharacterized protein si:ch211-214j8.12 [Toxotes jaculatrix]XP_040897315.1 uncharacterized protein si:ch211-214j8.12 [Toxotes jaculatrix]XP_040897316.1 uncharacterized protein si:ch211-214j8.12 [Toxotes jaculatrix]
MPLFRAVLSQHGGAKARAGKRKVRKMKWMGSCRQTEEDGSIPSLTRLCLLSLADNMKEVWVKDYADKYLDQYSFSYIMGPFNLLPGDLVEELTRLLCTRKQLSRAALHLLLVPQLRNLSLERCPGLVTSALCSHIAARCQGLWSMDLSGAQQLPSKVLSETLWCLPALRSLSLAGMTCDRCVVRTIAHRCRLLHHLDVSRCHFLSPAALLPLAGGAFCSSSASPSSSSSPCTSTSKSPISSDPSSSFSAPLSPLPLRSLLALDTGFGEQEGDPVAAAAYLLLSLPSLQTVALDGLSQACCIIDRKEFSQTDEFTDREGVPRLREVWREMKLRQGTDSWRNKREAAATDEEYDEEEDEEEGIMWEGYGGENEEDASRDEETSCSVSQKGKRRKRVLSQSGDESLILNLKDVKGLTCDGLNSLGRLCPDICSISVNADDHEDTRGRNLHSLLAAGLQTWSGQLQSLSIHFPGPLVALLPALQVAGSSLVSLTLEGVKTSPHTPLLEVIGACPRLRDLLISAEPPTFPQEEEDEVNQHNDRDLPRLPKLCSLTLNFSYTHSQMKPVMSWMSLKTVLRCLLSGSPLLEKLSLVSLPCPLNCVLQDVLRMGGLNLYPSAGSTDLPPMPLGRVQHIDLLRTDVEMTTVGNIMQRSKRLEFVDVSYCWQISQFEWLHYETFSNIQVVWK